MPEYIEREALEDSFRRTCDDVKTIYNALKHDEERRICSAEFCTWVECLMRVKEAPTADVAEVRHGYWKQADNTRKGHKFICSVCNRVSYYPQPTRDKKWVKHCGYSHCPHCLSKMDESGDVR